MRKIFLIVFLLQYFALPQSDSIDLYSPENIKLFADYLFCDEDYLRAVEQYELLKNNFKNDTIDFKIMLGYSNLSLYQKSSKIFNKLNNESIYYSDAYLLSMKNDLIVSSKPLKQSVLTSFSLSQDQIFNKLSRISTLYDNQPSLSKNYFLEVFDRDEQNELSLLYDYKFDPPYKSPAWAGVLSTLVPGCGKMYVGDWGDGIAGFLITGLFAYLAYDNFKNDNTTKAWIFTGIGAFFYAGNIYGSIAAAQIFNAKINFDFENGLKLFLEKENYFLPEYDFCQ